MPSACNRLSTSRTTFSHQGLISEAAPKLSANYVSSGLESPQSGWQESVGKTLTNDPQNWVVTETHVLRIVRLCRIVHVVLVSPRQTVAVVTAIRIKAPASAYRTRSSSVKIRLDTLVRMCQPTSLAYRVILSMAFWRSKKTADSDSVDTDPAETGQSGTEVAPALPTLQTQSRLPGEARRPKTKGQAQK